MDWLMGNRKKNDKSKPIIEEKKVYLDEVFVETRPSDIDLITLVTKPDHVDVREWIATHTISLFHNINLIYGTISEYCTAETCPLMQGPCQTYYTWVEERGKKLKCTAAQYIDYVMTFCQKSISNQKLFPTKYAHDFDGTFYVEMRKMHRYLFAVLSHLYYAHSQLLLHMQLHKHLNTVFAHFTLLNKKYELCCDMECLEDLAVAMNLPSNPPSPVSMTTSSPPTSASDQWSKSSSVMTSSNWSSS